MDKIISEIIIGAVILTLLVSVIPIYRSSAQLVRSAGEKMDENENIKEVTLGKLPAEGDFTSGRYLLELLDFCADRYRFLVSVKFSDKTYQFREENYAEAADVIKSDMLFVLSEIKKEDTFLELYFSYQSSDGEQNEA